MTAEILIAPSRSRSWPFLIFTGVMTLVGLFAAFLVWGAAGWGAPIMIIVPLVFALTFFVATLLIWQRNPRMSGVIRRTEDGFQIDYETIFGRRIGPYHIRWEDLLSIREISFRASQTQLSFDVSLECGERLGLIQPTTRRDLPRAVVAPAINLSGNAFDATADQIVEVFNTALKPQGKMLHYQGGEYIVATNRKWQMGPLDA